MVENNNSESSGNIFVSSCDSSNKTSRNSKCINVNNSTPKISASKNSKCKNEQNLVLSSCLTDSDSEDENTQVCDTDVDYENNSINSANDRLDLCMQNEKYGSKERIVLNEKKLVNKMISNYYNSKSVNIEDNRHVLKRLIPIVFCLF